MASTKQTSTDLNKIDEFEESIQANDLVPEVNDLSINVNGQGSVKATSRVMAATMSSRGDSECFEDDEDDDEEKLKSCDPVKSNQIENTTAQDTNSNKNEYCNNNSQRDKLKTAWSFWIDKCYKGTTQDEYEAGLKLIGEVETEQTFWSVFKKIPDVSKLPNRYSYHLMRNSRKPVWEDSENSSGGLWKFKCKKEDTSQVWQEALLAAIREKFRDSVSRPDDVIGVSVGRREKEDIVQIWNLDSKCEPQAKVCKKFKELVPDVKFSAVYYIPNSSYEVYPPEHSKN